MDKTCFNWIRLVTKTKLPPTAKHLCHYLSMFMNSSQDVAWPSQARIIDETGLAKSTVNKYLSLLEQEGWIIRERGNPTTNTRYVIDIPELAIEKLVLGSPSDGQGSPSLGQGSPTHGLR